jgi:hypothetical protein
MVRGPPATAAFILSGETTASTREGGATRRRIHDMVAAEKLLVHGFHYPFPVLGYSEKAATAIG